MLSNVLAGDGFPFRDLVFDAYFPRAQRAAGLANVNPWVRYNLFIRKNGVLCGMCYATLEAYLDVRDLLDGLDATHVKIVLSSGFDAEKVAAFRPFIDPERTIIGTGSWVGPMDFRPTGDIVEINESEDREGPWRPCLKVGREYTPSTRLQPLIGPV